MVSAEASPPTGNAIWRGGVRLDLQKVPDGFAVRLKPGVRASAVARQVEADHRRSLARENLDVFAVEPAARDAAMASVRRGGDVEFASHVYSVAGDPASRLFLTDEVLVQFRPAVDDAEIEGLTAGLGLQLVKPVAGLPRAYVFRVTGQAAENPIKLAERLLATGRVLAAEPNMAVEAQRFYVPVDPLFPDQWHLHAGSGPFLAPEAHIDAERAWDITRGQRSVVVAIADDAADLSHQDFQGPGKIVAPRDFAGRDFDPRPASDAENHGTACAGVAVAEENGVGGVGVAPGCALMPIRTSGMLDDNAVEELFDWAASQGASVVSCSWGAAQKQFPLSLRQGNAIHQAATSGRGGRGCVVVFAAGNANRPVSGDVVERGWPNDFIGGSQAWHGGFAAHPDVIAVAACTSLARRAAYSNWGPEISVCAPSDNHHPTFYFPGLGVTVTYPRIGAPLPGRGIVTTDRTGPGGYSGTDYTYVFGGTSSACPTVAGVAALVLSANPDLTARQVREILETTADKIVDDAIDPQLEQFLGSYDARGHSPWFGYGRVNAYQAVLEAVRRRLGDPAAGATYQGASAPDLAIPDGDPAGVRDAITLEASAAVQSVSIQVDIAHTYVGDLRLSLIAPDGQSVVLHDRGGARARGLQRSYDVAAVPALARLAGQPIRGQWTLFVQDLAHGDVGRLVRWEVVVASHEGGLVELEEAPGRPIPDGDPQGMARELVVDVEGQVLAAQVSLDLTHTHIGDLEVDLLSPAGTRIALHRRTGGAADNLITTYTPASLSDLHALRGEPVRGVWRLRVADLQGRDLGKLNRWTLRLTYLA